MATQFDIDSINTRLITSLQATESWKNVLFYSTNLSLLEPFAEEIKGLADYGNYCLNESKWGNAINKSSYISQLPALGQKEERQRSSTGIIRVGTEDTFLEVITLTITGTVVGTGTLNMSIRGATTIYVDITDGDSAIDVASLIVADALSFPLWTVTSEDNVVTFTSKLKTIYEGTNTFNLTTSTGISGAYDIPTAHDVNINIPAYSIFKTEEGTSFTNTENHLLTSSDSYIDIDVVQGVQKTLTFISTGNTNEEFEIDINDIAENYTMVTVNDIEFTKIPYLELSDIYNVQFEMEDEADKLDKYYEIENKSDFSGVYLKFGDGAIGDKLVAGDVVVFKYIETLGFTGNIGSLGVVNTVSSTIYDVNNIKVDMTCTNLDTLSGGSDLQTLSELKQQSAIFQTNNNAVTTENYKALIESQFNLKAVVWGAFETNVDNGDPRWTFIDTDENLVNLASIDNNFDPINDIKKEEILDYLQPIKSITDIVNFVDAEIINFYYNINAITGKKNLINSVKSNIRLGLIDIYSFNNSEFYNSLYLSDYVRAIDSIDLVDNHLTTIAFYRLDTFNDASFGADGLLQLTSITSESVSVYVKDLTGTIANGEQFLIGTYDSGGNFVPEVDYAGSTGSIVYGTGAYSLQLATPLAGDETDYEIYIYFTITDSNVILSKRNQILKYASELTTINVSYS